MEEWNIPKLHQMMYLYISDGVHTYGTHVHHGRICGRISKNFLQHFASFHSTITLRQINTNRRNFSCHVFIFITPEKKCFIFICFTFSSWEGNLMKSLIELS